MNIEKLERLEKILLDAIEQVKEPVTTDGAKALAMLTMALLEVSREWRRLR